MMTDLMLFAQSVLVQKVKNFTYGMSSLLILIILPIIIMLFVEMAVKTRQGLGRLYGNMQTKRQGLAGKARNYAQGTDFYQRRELARNARTQERKRSNLQSYAEVASSRGLRGALLRRRAAGGVTGQVFNTNQAGQQRARQAAEEQLRKTRQEEAGRAAIRMQEAGFDGDNDFMGIARTAAGGTYNQRDAAGNVIRSMQVTEADRQAAINNLVQQGRTQQVRNLEAVTARGPNGAAVTDLHQMLDNAYRDHGGKLSDKAPDLMPSRRTTNGVAAFTDLKPEDVTKWHHSTMSAAQNFYNQSRIVEDRDAAGNVIGSHDQAPLDREQMLRALSQATQAPSTRSQLSLEQVSRARDILHDAQAAGFADLNVVNNIENIYRDLGGV